MPDHLHQLRERQNTLAAQVDIPSTTAVDTALLRPKAVLFGLDIQYTEEVAQVGVAIQHYDGTLLADEVGTAQAGMEYVPRFFCFREGPPLAEVVRAVIQRQGIVPDFLLVDGHGIAHPRRFGVACLLGVELNIPTIGIAKRTLLPYTNPPEQTRGSCSAVLLEEEVVGQVVRTQSGVKPVYVSPGHRVNLATSVAVALELAQPYRVPEPLRRADQLARRGRADG